MVVLSFEFRVLTFHPFNSQLSTLSVGHTPPASGHPLCLRGGAVQGHSGLPGTPPLMQGRCRFAAEGYGRLPHPVSADAPRRCSHSLVKDQLRHFVAPLRGNPNWFGLGRAANSVPLNAGRHMPPHKQSAKQGCECNISPPHSFSNCDFSLYFQA